MMKLGSAPMMEELDMSVACSASRMQSFMVAGRQGPSASKTATGLVRGGIRKKRREHHSIFSRFFLVVTNENMAQEDSRYAYFSIDGVLSYVGFCDDFGPMSLGTIFQFCRIVDDQFKENPNRPIAMVTDSESKTVTNAIFLIGAYMIMKLGMTPFDVESRFQILSAQILSYRDVSPGEQNFELFVKDCWDGLWKAKSLGWVDFSPNAFHIEEYEHYDDPLNADLHDVVPGKFIAMRGPKDLPDDLIWQDSFLPSGEFSHRDFSPKHYIDILSQFHVRAVIRLNSVEYSKEVFEDAGVAVVEQFFEDCTDPPADIVGKFMMLAEGMPGAIAVHCKAGLGRTGTLIALYMMKHHGFSAREAMGWLRIVRPGSVIGTQQNFLCSKEGLMRRAADKFRREGPKRIADGATPDAVRRFTAAVDDYVDVRLRAFHASSAAAGMAAAQPSSSTPPPVAPAATITTLAPVPARRPSQLFAAAATGTPPAAGSARSSMNGPAAMRAAAAAAAAAEKPMTREEILAAHVSAATNRRNGVRALGVPLPPLSGRHAAPCQAAR